MSRLCSRIRRCLIEESCGAKTPTFGSSIASAHRCERGFLSFITCIAVLFFALLVTMVFNVGAAVRQKIDVQNAADAAILTSTSMTARGMNAVTLTNHMLGELTAILVIHEALGGTELDDLAPKNERKQSNVSNLLNKSLTALLPLSSSYELHALDEQAVKQMKRDGGSDDDSQGKHQAFATIFDARCTMKYYMTEVLIGRLVAIACRFIPFGIGEAIYWGINIPLTVLVGKMLQEVIILDGVEQIAKVFSTVAKRNIVENRMLPFLENYGEVCFKQFPVIGERVAQESARRNNVTLHLYPARLPLPIEREPEPPTESQSFFAREPQAGDASSDADFLSKALDLLGSATELLGDANDVLGTNGGVQNPGVSLRPNPGNDGYERGANWSRDSLPRLSRDDWKKVEQSQWTRATYPYVQGWRKPIREWFAGVLMVSRAGTWYSRWTNRYTVTKAWQFRNGQYGGEKGRRKLAMYVMQEAPTSGKGREDWTRDGDRAEQLFTQMAFVHRDARQPLAGAIFGAAPKDGIVCYAQAIVYNANRQNAEAWRDGGTYQPEVGWDTLNWRTPAASARAYEFLKGDEAGMRIMPPSVPFLLFNKAEEHPEVKLNWQAKLTPVTRYGDARISFVRMPSNMRNVLLTLPLDLGAFRTH